MKTQNVIVSRIESVLQAFAVGGGKLKGKALYMKLDHDRFALELGELYLRLLDTKADVFTVLDKKESGIVLGMLESAMQNEVRGGIGLSGRQLVARLPRGHFEPAFIRAYLRLHDMQASRVKKAA